MQVKIPLKRVLFKYVLTPTLLGLFSIINFSSPHLASATATSTINFQARLLTSQGNLVADGNYNVEFKLYNALTSSGSSQGSCTGDSACLWTETRTAGNTVRVVNGYLTVNLGSVNAFPSSIDWSQKLYLTMNIGGTGGSPSWDGEMTPRILLTAVPYAFSAKQLKAYDNPSGFSSLLQFSTPTANDTLTLPDASGTLCIDSSAACGFAPTSGSGNYIQNSLTQQTANFNISGTGTAGTSILTPLLDTPSGTSTLNIGTTNASQINLNQNTTVANNDSFTAGGGALFKDATNSTTAFQIQNAAGTITDLAIDTVNSKVIINDTLKTADQSAPSTNSNNLSLISGNATGNSSNSGYIRIDSGSAGSGGTTGIIKIGDTNASSITIGHGSVGLAIPASSSLTLGSAGSATGSIILDNATNSHTVTFQSGIPTSNVTFTLPSADSSNGSCLITNGSGVLTLGSCTGPGSGAANTALSNLAGVAINTSLLPGSAGSINLGSSSLPFGNLFIAGSSSTPGSNNFEITGTATSADTITLPDQTGTVCLSTGNCRGAGGTLQTSYDNSVGGTTPEIKVDSTRGAVDIQDADTSISAALFNIRANNPAGLGNLLFTVNSSGQVGINTGSSNPSADLTFGEGSDRTLNVLTRTTNVAGNALTIIAGKAGSGANAHTGGNLNLQGGDANGITGNANGGSVYIYGGAKVNSGTAGNVVLAYNGSSAVGSVGIGNASPGYPLDVTGDVNTSTAYRIGGVSICTASGCTPSSGSSSYIQLQGSTPGTQQTGNFNISGTGIAGTLEASNLDTSSATTLTVGNTNATQINLNQNTVVASNKSLTADGSALFEDATNSTTALQVQNSSGNNVVSIDTSGNILQLGKASTITTTEKLFSASGSGSISLTPANPSSTNYTITIPAETGTICTTAGSAACQSVYTGTTDVNLQGSTPGTQQTGNFNISGTGIAGTSIQTPLLDTPSGTTTLNIGTTNATSGINLNQNTTIATNKTLTADGSALFQDATASTSALQVQNATGSVELNVDTSTTANLITNGDFESGTAGWAAKGSATISRVSSQQQRGNWSLQAATTAAANDGAKYNTTLSSTTQYTLSFYAKVSATTGTVLNFGYAQDGSTETGSTTSLNNNITTNWTYYTLTFTTGTVSGTPYIFIKQNDATSRNIYIDSVQLQTGGTATAFSPGGAVQILGLVNSPLSIQPLQDSTNVFSVHNAAGSLVIRTDTLNQRVGIDTSAPGYPLDVTGDINSSVGFTISGGATSGNYLRGNGTNFVSSAIQAGDIPSGSGNYIQNNTGSAQTANFNIQSNSSSNVTAIIQGAASQSVDILDVKTSTPSTVFSIGSTGNITATGTYNSNTFTSSTLQFGASGTATLQSASGQALNFTGNASSTISTSSGNLTLRTASSNTIFIADNAIAGSVQIGDATTTNTGNTQTITIGNLTAAGTTNVTIGAFTGASGGNTTIDAVGTLALQAAASGTINIGNNAVANTINLGDTSTANTGNTQTIAIGNLTAAGTTNVTIGAYTGATAGTTTIHAFSSIILQPAASGTIQMQNSVGANELYLDTSSTDASGNTLNYLTYGGFESGSFSNANAGWAAVGSATLSQNNNKIHTFQGLYSAQIATTASNAGLTTSTFTSTPPTATTYIVSFYAAVSSGTMDSALFTVQSTDGTTHTCSPTTGTSINANGFQRLYCQLPATTGSMTALQITQSDSTSRTIYIDGVQLQKNSFNGNTITAPTPYDVGSLQVHSIITSPLILINNGDSTSALQVNQAAGTAIFTVDTLNGQVIIGNGSNTLTISSTGISASGTTRHTKKIILTPEYAGAVLDLGSGGANTGTMTSGNDNTQKENYYKWTTSQGSAQTYDIVISVPLPADFDSSSWPATAPLTVDVNLSATTAGETVVGTLYDTSGTAVTNWNTCSLTPTVTGWKTSGAGATSTPAACNISSGTFNPNGTISLRLHISADSGSNTEVGNITLQYYSKY